jgi:phage host-nuclease inhibitor protein Gam
VTVKSGRFGSYINWNKVNAKLPSEYVNDPSELPLEEAWSLIQEKATSGKINGKGKSTSGKANVPEAPKRPHSAYLLFSAERRAEVSSQGLSLGEVSRELSRLWKEAPDDERKPFLERASIAKSVYEIEKKKLAAHSQGTTSKAGNGAPGERKSLKTSTKILPKRPRSAYIFFCSANRDRVSADFKTLGDISKELARRWATLDPTSQKEYIDMAAQDKLRYEKEKTEKMRPTSTATNLPDDGTIFLKMAKTVQKRPPSAYMLFCTAHRNDIVDEDGNKLSLPFASKRLAQMWKECDDNTRAKYQAESEAQKALASIG